MIKRVTAVDLPVVQFTSFYMPGDFVSHVRLMDEGFSDPETAIIKLIEK